MCVYLVNSVVKYYEYQVYMYIHVSLTQAKLITELSLDTVLQTNRPRCAMSLASSHNYYVLVQNSSDLSSMVICVPLILKLATVLNRVVCFSSNYFRFMLTIWWYTAFLRRHYQYEYYQYYTCTQVLCQS